MGMELIARVFLLYLINSSTFCTNASGDDGISTVNGIKALHKVDERFLSISIDPAVLLTGLNLSESSLELYKHLAPSFVRLAGPSTQFVKYVDFEDEHSSNDASNVVVTPSMWFGINEWFTLANLTPVFGINDFQTANGVWNPKSTLPLLDLADKLNVTCYWQLGYDCCNKTELQYKEDLSIFRHILDAFPNKSGIWKTVGSDPSKCMNVENVETAKRFIDDLEHTISAVSWENVVVPFPKLLQLTTKPKIASWLVYPKAEHPVGFASALTWAKQIGDGGKNGFEVVFRQPRLHEIFRDSPAYWVSVLFKNLMGRTVLDVKTSGNNNPQSSVYAHCSSNQNSFTRSGAMTVFIVNDSPNNYTTYLRFGTPFLKSAEVRSYVLTSPNEGSTETHLNGRKLSSEDLKKDFEPKFRRAKILNYLSISVPPKSIGFYVLPTARIPACISEEADLNSVMAEIYKDQNISFSDDATTPVDVSVRHTRIHSAPSLHDLHMLMEKELESDERYYKRMKLKKSKKTANKSNNNAINRNVMENTRNYFIERAKLNDRQRKQLDSHQINNRGRIKFKSNSGEIVVKTPKMIKELELELSSSEIRKILSDRAKTKAAKKNIKFTSRELEEIMNKATQKFLNDRNTLIKIKPKTKRDTDDGVVRGKKDINMRLLKLKTLGDKKRGVVKQQLNRFKSKKLNFPFKKETNKKRERRDINMDLLKIKTEIQQNANKNKPSSRGKFGDKEEKKATMRSSDESSDEFFEKDTSKDSEEKKNSLPHREVFAQLANSEDKEFVSSTEKSFIKLKTTDLRKFTKVNFFPKTPKISPLIKPNLHHHIKKLPAYKSKDFHTHNHPSNNHFTRIDLGSLDEDDSQFPLEEYDDAEDGENFPCIHEYVNHKESKNNKKSNVTELWEFGGEVITEDKDDNHLISPPLKTRTHSIITSIMDDLDDYSDNLREASDSLDLGKDYGDLDSGYDDKRPVKIKRRIRSMTVDGDYEPLIDSLRNWRPFDIIGLKSDKVRLQKSLPPPCCRTVVLKKRSIVGDDGIDSRENEIDTGDGETQWKKNYDKEIVFPSEKEKLKLIEEKPMKTEEKPRINIQKIREKRADNLWTTICNKVTDFFNDMGGKIKSYIKNIVN